MFSGELVYATKVSAELQASIENQVKDLQSGEILNYSYKFHEEDLEIAMVYAKIAMKKAIKAKDRKGLFYVLRDIGYYHENNNLLAQGVQYYQEAYQLAKEINDNDIEMIIMTDLAIVYRKLGSYSLSKNYHNRCIALAIKAGNKELQEDNLNGLGLLYETIGDYEKSVAEYLKSLSIAESRRDKEDIITTLQNLGNVYMLLNDPATATNTIDRAYQLSLQLGDTNQIANVLYDYAGVLRQNGQLEEAMLKSEAALRTYENSKNKIKIARSMVQLGDLLTEGGELDQAKNILLDAMEEYKEYMGVGLSAELSYRIGSLYMKQEEYELAEKFLNESLALAEKHSLKDLLSEVSHELYKLNSARKDYKAALDFLNTYMELNNQMFDEERAKNIAEIQFRFDADKKEKRLQVLRLERNSILLFAAAGILLVTLVFVGYIARSKNMNNKALENRNKEIEAQNIKLHESNQVLKQFTYVAAHDLKEPLRNIGSFANLLERKFRGKMDDEANEYLGFIRSGATYLDGLLNDLLSYTQISGQEPAPEMVDTNSELDQVLLELRPQIMKSGARINFPGDIPDVLISKTHLHVLFYHLISNAIKFTERAPIVDISFKKIKNQEVLIHFKDNGIGIPKEAGRKVFNLFHRLDKHSGLFEGSGVGLTICQNIVDKYNGSIDFTSEVGEGTIFTVRLPLYDQRKAIEKGEDDLTSSAKEVSV